MNKTAAQILLCFENPSTEFVVKETTINLTSNEATKLEKYCTQTGRTVADVIQELIRDLPTP